MRTDRRIPIPQKTAFAGGNTWRMGTLGSQIRRINEKERCEAYVAKTVFKDLVGREGMQHIDDGSEPLEQFGIAPLKFVKSPCLLLEYTKDRIGIIAAIDLRGKWVVAEIFPSLLGILLQGSIEKRLKAGGREDCTRKRGHKMMGQVLGGSRGKGREDSGSRRGSFCVDILMNRRPCYARPASWLVDAVPVCAALS